MKNNFFFKKEKNFILLKDIFEICSRYYSENLNKKIIAPSIWFGSRYSHWNLSDLYCENFIKI